MRAGSLEDALSALASEGDEARLLAGGQSLIAMMNLRLVRPSALVDVNGVCELDYVRADDATLTVGALTRLSTAEVSQEVAGACPLMSEAIRHIAHRPIRNRGTVGGNLSHAGSVLRAAGGGARHGCAHGGAEERLLAPRGRR